METVAGNVPAVMTKLFEAMKETVGIDLGEIMRADTYDAKVTRNIHVTGMENGSDEAAAALTGTVAGLSAETENT